MQQHNVFDVLPFWSIADAEEATKPAGFRFFPSAEKCPYACFPNPQSIDPPTHAWQANRLLQTYQENLTPTQHIALFCGKNLNLHPRTETSNPTEASQMLICSLLPCYHTVPWTGFNFILMESRGRSCLFLSHTYTLQMCSDECASVCPACTCP